MGSSAAELLLVLKAKNLASREVGKLGGDLDTAGKRSKGLGGALGGLGKVAGLVALTGIGALVAGIVGATSAAAEEEVGIARLNAALKANDTAHSASSATIDAAISKREELAFADDELRDSLAFLVTKTHDSQRALDLQSTAMDLARLKGISLQDASMLLTKGLDGNQKVLKQLGIQLPKNATEQQRLAAIQKAAGGQAKKYGETAAGAQQAFQIALGDLVEDAGALFLPVMRDMFRILRTNVIPAIRTVAAAVGRWLDDNRPLINQLKVFAGTVIKNVSTALGTLIGWIGSVVKTITGNKAVMRGLGTVFDIIGKAIGGVITAIGSVVGWISTLVNWFTHSKPIMNTIGGIFQTIGKAIRAVVSAIKGVINFGGSALGVLGDIVGAISGGGDNHHARGGWVGLHGPELSWLGERGPEYVVPAGASSSRAAAMAGGSSSSSSSGVQIVGVSADELADMIDRKLYFRLQRAAPTVSRT